LAVAGISGVLAALVGVTIWQLERRARIAIEVRLATRQEQFSVLAHELKTPLALISATAEVLLSPTPGLLTEDQRRFVEEIDLSAARILLLADNILTESRLQAGVFTPSFADTDVRPLLREVSRTMRRLADQHGQRLALDYPQRMDQIAIDAALVRQAVVNLVQNAIRHTSQGGVVAIRAYQNERDVVISVWDDGVGLDPAHRKAVLQRFVSYSGGTGLGLTIVETIAGIHGGHLMVDTSLGDGAAFLLALPRTVRG